MKNYETASALVTALCLNVLKYQGEEFELNNDTDSLGNSAKNGANGDLLSFEGEYKGERVLGLITPDSALIVVRAYRLVDVQKSDVLEEGFFTRIPSRNEIEPLFTMDKNGNIVGEVNANENVLTKEMRALTFFAAFNMK